MLLLALDAGAFVLVVTVDVVVANHEDPFEWAAASTIARMCASDAHTPVVIAHEQ